MRHKRRGRKLGRSPSHRKAMLRNLASSLFLTERETFDVEKNAPKVKGRVVTTLHKAKEVRPLVEKCITIARRSLESQREADKYFTQAQRNSDEWREWRQSDEWRKWNAAIAPAVAARRRAVRLLGDKEAVSILFDEVAPRFSDRDGGYTRILRLAKPRLGDAGIRAVLEFVGGHDRVKETSEKPAFTSDTEDTEQQQIDEQQVDEQQVDDQQEVDEQQAVNEPSDQEAADQEAGELKEATMEDAASEPADQETAPETSEPSDEKKKAQ